VTVPGPLCAVLLSPPTTSGARTLKAVHRAASILGYSDLHVVNLLAAPASDVPDLVRFPTGDVHWEAARSAIQTGLSSAAALLFAWGLVRRMGSARHPVEHQVAWLLDQAAAFGHSHAWAVGEVRHPSRWHQYTADKHGRTKGGDPDARLRAVLVRRGLLTFADVA
jgi:Protein of unknown function (DUF1643)